MQLGFVVNMFSQAKASGERLLEILEAKEDIMDEKDPVQPKELKGHVTFKNVSLTYIEDDDAALKKMFLLMHHLER